MTKRDRLWRATMRASQSPLLTPWRRARVLRAIGVCVPPTATIMDGVFIGSRQVRFGEHAKCNVDVFLDGSAPIVIGDYARLAPRVLIITATHDIKPGTIRCDGTLPAICKGVTIGRGSWLCTGVVVHPGVTIGEGCVIAAGSVVTRDCLPNGLYAGVPARRVRDLPIARGHLSLVG